MLDGEGFVLREADMHLKRVHKKNKRPVMIGDVVYESVNQAAQHLRTSGPTIGKKIREKKLINGMVGRYLTKEERKERGL